MQSRPITVGLFTHKKINASPKKRCTYWYLGPWNNFQQKIAALTIVWSIWKQALEKKGDPCFWSYCPHTHKIIIMQKKKKKSFIFLLLSSLWGWWWSANQELQLGLLTPLSTLDSIPSDAGQILSILPPSPHQPLLQPPQLPSAGKARVTEDGGTEDAWRQLGRDKLWMPGGPAWRHVKLQPKTPWLNPVTCWAELLRA